MFASLSSKGRTARSFGGLRMTEKWEDCHPMFASLTSKGRTARSFGGLRMTEKRGGLSSYVCKPLFKGQNSQILRRPQDDRKKRRIVILCLHRYPKLIVNSRPTHHCHPEASEGSGCSACIKQTSMPCHSPLTVIPRPPMDIVFLFKNGWSSD